MYSVGFMGTSPSLNWCLKSRWSILFTSFFWMQRIFVFHDGGVFTDSKTVGLLSTALKAPEISIDLFQKEVHVRWIEKCKPSRNEEFLLMLVKQPVNESFKRNVMYNCICEHVDLKDFFLFVMTVTPVRQRSPSVNLTSGETYRRHMMHYISTPPGFYNYNVSGKL